MISSILSDSLVDIQRIPRNEAGSWNLVIILFPHGIVNIVKNRTYQRDCPELNVQKILDQDVLLAPAPAFCLSLSVFFAPFIGILFFF